MSHSKVVLCTTALSALALVAACGRFNFDALGDDGDASVPVGCTATPDHAGLRLYLRFDEGTGSATSDRSGNNNTGTLVNMDNSNWGAGRFGGAVELRGPGQLVSAGSGATLDDVTPFTLCMWIRPRSISAPYATIADKSSDGFMGGWNVYLEQDLDFGMMTHYRRWAVGGAIAIDQWQHVCASWDGSDGFAGIVLYQDAVRMANADTGTSGGTSIGLESDAPHPVSLGAIATGSYELDGFFDELQIYDRVLTSTEIQTIYDCTGT